MFNIKTAKARTRPMALAFAAGAMALSAMPAQAARPQERTGIAVQYRDLDLASADGQRTLETRLDRAARNVCGMDEHTVGTRLPNRGATRCYNETRAQFAQQFAQVIANENRGG